MSWFTLLGRHDIVDLLQFVGEPLLLGELVLLERNGELLVVLDGVRVELVQGAVRVELGGVHLNEQRRKRNEERKNCM